MHKTEIYVLLLLMRRLNDMKGSLLEINDLKTYFFTESGIVKAVDGISFRVDRGEIVGLIGESGSGKTVTALSVLRVVPSPGEIVGGKIIFEDKNLLDLKEKNMRGIRGKKIAMVFQDPTSSIDSLYSIGSQLTEVIKYHNNDLSKKEVMEKAVELLAKVKMSDPEILVNQYPHQLSGGMKQRVALARALAGYPILLFADEPTTNLDVTIQAQILELLRDLNKSQGMTMILITHNMGIVAEETKSVVVVYAGMLCESGDTRSLFKKPLHPYTAALLSSVPRVDVRRELEVIPGNIPDPIEPPSGCRFHPRCKYTKEICKKETPPIEIVDNGRLVACHRWRELSLG